MPDIKLY
jgi:hypothetical protein